MEGGREAWILFFDRIILRAERSEEMREEAVWRCEEDISARRAWGRGGRHLFLLAREERQYPLVPEREDSVGREAAAGALGRAEGEIDDCAASEKDFRETKIVATVLE